MPDTQQKCQKAIPQTRDNFDAVVIGAGLAGLFMLYRLRELGLRVRVLEAASELGGTWFWNRYPGGRCDVESMEYSVLFKNRLFWVTNAAKIKPSWYFAYQTKVLLGKFTFQAL